jgi:signal transduction histidine kinase
MPEDGAKSVALVGQIEAVPKILDVVCRITGMGFAAVARVTGDQWIACAVRDRIAFGLVPGGELPVETTLCHDVRRSQTAIVIEDVARDDVYDRHSTPARYGFQSYISVPIVLADGSFFGTLCAIDPRPAKLKTPEIIDMFHLFSQLIGTYVTSSQQLTTANADLANEREVAALREEFIAVLGHDLRNPLGALSSGLDMLSRARLDENPARIVRLMQNTVVRMASLIDDILDFARGRLGGGLPIERDTALPLEPILRQIVAELGTSWPGRTIETDFRLPTPISCDPGRIGQLFSNLLANALTHGESDTPIRATATSDDGMLTLTVANNGPRIPPDARAKLFSPFTRGTANQQGLGLGLYICAEIAKAHGGHIEVTSSDEETRFTFRMTLR